MQEIIFIKFNECLYKLFDTMYELPPCNVGCKIDRMNCFKRVPESAPEQACVNIFFRVKLMKVNWLSFLQLMQSSSHFILCVLDF